jgi:hypothetical protein
MPIRISDIISRKNDNDIYPLLANETVGESSYVVKTLGDRDALKSRTLGLKGSCLVITDSDNGNSPSLYYFSRSSESNPVSWTRLSLGASLPEGTVVYIGTYNAATNTPDLSITGTKVPGHLYAVSQDGTQNLGGGSVAYSAGDFIICSQTNVWEKLNTSASATGWTSITGKPDNFPFLFQEDSLTAIDATKLKIVTNNANEVTTSGTEVTLNLPSVYTASAITVNLPVGQTKIGNYSNGSVIPLGTSFQTIISNLLVATNPATYTGPNTSKSFLTNSVNVAAVYEIGTTLSTLELIGTFVKNDAGDLVPDASPTGSGTDFCVKLYKQLAPATSYTLDQTIYDTDPVGNDVSPYTYNLGDFTASGLGTYKFKIEFNYEQGPVKNDSSGQPSPSGQIAAGTISTEVSFVTQRRSFWGTPGSIPTNSAGVRALTDNALGHVNGSKFTINIPIGATRVVFAYPATLRDVTSVIYVEGLNADVKGAFTLTTISVNDASGSGAVNYKVYSFTPVSAFASSATYNVTI